MLAKLWRKGNTHPSLVGLQTCTAIMEVSVVIFRKKGLDLPQEPFVPLLSMYSKDVCCTTVEHVFKWCLLYHSWAFIQQMPTVPLLSAYSKDACCTTGEHVVKGCFTLLQRHIFNQVTNSMDACNTTVGHVFIFYRNVKQPRCHSTDKQIKKLWYTYTMK